MRVMRSTPLPWTAHRRPSCAVTSSPVPRRAYRQSSNCISLAFIPPRRLRNASHSSMQNASIDAVQLQPQPLEHARALPAALYTDPLALAFEQRAIFARHWQMVAHVSQLSGSGDHVVFDLAGVPVMIVRGADGELRGMHNVCRHRAGPLALCDGRA